MKSIAVSIQGISPLLMHAFPMAPPDGLDKMTPAEQAEHHVYRHPVTRTAYIPGANLHRGLISAGKYSKGKGRASLAGVVPAAVFVDDEYLWIDPPEYTVDSRPIVVPATGGRIVRHRARWDEWRVAFVLTFDEVLLSATQVRRLVDDLGQRVGLLDFRPERKGPFGRFMVTDWTT